MIGQFGFNGKWSNEFNLICKSVNRPLLPAIRPRMIEVYGRSGVIDYGGGDYATRLITMHIAYKGKNFIELRSRARNIAAWLNVGNWSRLVFDDEPDKFYFARIISNIDFETINRVGEADIIFECQPFAYMVVDTSLDPTWEEADFLWATDLPINTIDSYQFSATGNTSFVFNNPGTVIINKNSPQGSKSDIIVTGIWTNISISLNGSTLTFSEPSVTNKSLVINNVNMEITLNGANKLSKLSGDIDSFLSIVPGDNTINISGTGVNVNVLLDFTPAWL